MAIAALQPVRDHFKFTPVEKLEQPVCRLARQGFFPRALRRHQLGRVDPDDANLAVAQLEGVAVDDAG